MVHHHHRHHLIIRAEPADFIAEGKMICDLKDTSPKALLQKESKHRFFFQWFKDVERHVMFKTALTTTVHV